MRTLLSMLKAGERDEKKGALLIKAALKHDCVEMRVPPQPVPKVWCAMTAPVRTGLPAASW
jgi:hypothetical protein